MAPAAESPTEASSSTPAEDTAKSRSSPSQQEQTAAAQDQPDHDDTNGESNRRSQKSPRKSTKKSKKRSTKHKSSLAEHEQLIRDHIDTLKARLNEQKDDITLSETIDTLEGLSAKLKNTPLAEPRHDSRPHGLSGNETISMLHFFYIVRLAQQGFFSVISSAFPEIEMDAIVYLCDKLVGSSLFAVKDASDLVRQSKREDVFGLLRKLNAGTNEAVGEGYTTTYRQMKDMIGTLIENSLSQAQSSISSSSNSSSSPSGWPLAPADAQPTTQHCAPPVWLVVPFNSMIDMSALSLYQSSDSKVAEPSVPDTPSMAAPTAADETATSASSSPQTQDDERQSQQGSEASFNDRDDDDASRGGGRGRGRGRGRGYGRGRGRGEGGGRGYRASFRGRNGDFYRNARGDWTPRGG